MFDLSNRRRLQRCGGIFGCITCVCQPQSRNVCVQSCVGNNRIAINCDADTFTELRLGPKLTFQPPPLRANNVTNLFSLLTAQSLAFHSPCDFPPGPFHFMRVCSDAYFQAFSKYCQLCVEINRAFTDCYNDNFTTTTSRLMFGLWIAIATSLNMMVGALRLTV